MSGVGQEQTKPPEHQTSDMVGKRKSALQVGKAGESWGWCCQTNAKQYPKASAPVPSGRHLTPFSHGS